MEFQSVIDVHRSQVRFYQILSLTLLGLVMLLAIIVPSSLKRGPYVVKDSNSLYSVVRSEPWKLTVSRVEGFLRFYLAGRYEWSKESFEKKKLVLKEILSPQAYQRMKESLLSYETIAKAQGARGYPVLENFRFSNKEKLIEAQISRVIRVGNTGVVTPLLIRISFEEDSISETNPYGLRIKSIEEKEVSSDPDENGSSS